MLSLKGTKRSRGSFEYLKSNKTNQDKKLRSLEANGSKQRSNKKQRGKEPEAPLSSFMKELTTPPEENLEEELTFADLIEEEFEKEEVTV